MSELAPAGDLVLACVRGHRFDTNRKGFASLVAGSRNLIGDSPAMLDSRGAFLEGNWFHSLREAVGGLVAAESPRRLIDIGCGTGYYLRGVLDSVSRGQAAESGADLDSDFVRALAVDLSPTAVARTVRAGSGHPSATTHGLVADVWSPLPIRDGAADVVINIFAPRNPAEFRRVLAPQGLLAVVVPQAGHLQELRDAGLALEVHANKLDDLVQSLKPDFELESTLDLSSVLHLSPSDVRALLGMGPSAHHLTAPSGGDEQPTRSITAAFHVLGFRRS